MTMKTLILASILSISTLWACTPTTGKTTAPAGEPTAKEAPAEATGPEARAEPKELLIKADELRVEGEIVWFEPDTSVKRSSYTRYAFEKARFEKVVGSTRPDKDFTAMVQITKTEQKNSRPADPDAPSPDGGFDLTIHHAELLGLK
jgi:hypothetical protein